MKPINRIKIVLVEKQKTGKWLAEQLGRDPATVSRWRSNLAIPTPVVLEQVVSMISAMNLMLHGVDNPDLYDKNSLEEEYNVADKFSLVLANPPFKGSLESSTVDKSLSNIVKTKKTGGSHG